MRCDFFFCASLRCFGFIVVDTTERSDSYAIVDRMRLCHMGAAAALATKLSLRLQLTIVALVNPVAQETRGSKPPSAEYKFYSQMDLGFPWDPRRFTSVQETEVRGYQAVVGCSRKMQFMGSCDVLVLTERFTSSKQRCRIRT